MTKTKCPMTVFPSVTRRNQIRHNAKRTSAPLPILLSMSLQSTAKHTKTESVLFRKRYDPLTLLPPLEKGRDEGRERGDKD